MFGLPSVQTVFTLGAIFAIIGPKDLPIIARTAGRLVGRVIGYIQLARGEIDTVVQRSQTTQVHKELKDAMAQLDAIRHEIRSVSFVNYGPETRPSEDIANKIPVTNDSSVPEKIVSKANKSQLPISQDTSATSDLSDMHGKATAYAKLASAVAVNTDFSMDRDKLNNESLPVLPVSAESAGLLPKRQGGAVTGSDIVLEAILEADVAHNAKHFFASHPEMKQT